MVDEKKNEQENIYIECKREIHHTEHRNPEIRIYFLLSLTA